MAGGVLAVLLFAALAAACGVTAQSRDSRFFQTNQFWDGFGSGIIGDAGVQKRLQDNLELALDRLDDMGQSMHSFTRRLEDRVQHTLPSWMRHPERQSLHEERLSHKDAPVEAIIGSFGDESIDDGLRVFFDGEADQEPHIVPKEILDRFLPNSDDDQKEDEFTPIRESVPPPQTGGPLFDLRFDYPMFNRFPNFGGSPFTWTARIQPWWKGENVCIDETEIDEAEQNSVDAPPTSSDQQAEEAVMAADEEIQEEIEREDAITSGPSVSRAFFFGSMEVHSCREEQDKYTCSTRSQRRGISRSVEKVYRCCHGFLKEATGCTKVNMVPLPESLETLGLTDFLSQVKSAGVIDMLENENLTIFAPSNEAVQDYTADLMERNDLDISNNEVYRRRRSADTEEDDVTTMVLSHITEGFHYSGDMDDEQILPSKMEGSTLRVNIYRTQVPPIITINCARVTTINQPSSNGIVHTIDRIVRPATRSIGDIISNDPQFTTLKKLVSASGLLQQLREDGQLTLFAPTDAAFAASVPQEELQALIDGSSCLPAILKNHLLPNVICSSAVTNPVSKTINFLDKHLQIRLEDTGKLFVEDAQIVAKDIMGTNGVIHIIDAPLMPSEAKSVLEVLELQNLTRFLDLLHVAEMTKEIEELRDISIVAPSNAAIDNVEEEYINELKNDKERLRNILRYHVSHSPFSYSTLKNNHMVETQAGHPLRINLYSGPITFSLSNLLNPVANRVRVTAGCGRVTLTDSRACGASVHVVDTFLEPPTEGIMEALERDPNFSIFSKIAKESSMSEELSGEGPLTMLVPSDHVFRTLPQEELDSLLADEELKEELVMRHTLREHMCCSGIAPNTFSFRDNARTAHGSTIRLRQSASGLLRAGPARITQCAKPLRNGLVHTVNRLFVEPHIVDAQAESRWNTERVRPIILRMPIFSGTIFGGHH